jgi:hypothetical protein
MREFWTLTSSGVRIEAELKWKNNLVPSLNSSGAQFEPKLEPKNNSSIQIVERRGRLASFLSRHIFGGGGGLLLCFVGSFLFSPKQLRQKLKVHRPFYLFTNAGQFVG